MRGVAMGLGALLALGFVWTPSSTFAAEAPTAVLDVKKTASAEQVKPGETLTYTIEVACSTLTDVGCNNAVFADAIPPEFEIQNVVVANAPFQTPIIDGQNVSVVFNEQLSEGVIGLIDNANATITITVKLREDVPYEKNGVNIPNTAQVTADNATKVTSTANVKPVLEKHLATEATKSFNPTAGQAKPGTETTLTLSGANKSNAGADTLTLTDPVDPNATGNPFDYLAITGIDSVQWPEGATTATVEYWNGTAWVQGSVATKPGAPNAPPASATGIRVTFTGPNGTTIPAGATGGLTLKLEQRENVADLEESITLKNTVESAVTNGGDRATDTDDATYKVVTEPLSVAAKKSFDPDVVLPGGASTVSLSGSNAGDTPLSTLTIREPASGDFDSRLDFTGFTSSVEFPQGADTGDITLVYLDRNGDEQSITVPLTNGGAYPALPVDFGSLKHFEITFTDTTGEPIIAGAESNLTFGVTAAEGLAKDTTIDNVVGVTGTAGDQKADATATDTLTLDEHRIELETQKKISPGQIWGTEGETATIQLPTTVGKGSTANATQILVNDPELKADGTPKDSDWWDHFRPTAITKTDVPPGVILTVRYFDTVSNTWVVLAENVKGATSFSMAIPEAVRDQIGGLQFEFTSDEPGFAPGATVQPNITTELKESLAPKPAGSDITVENCSSASATAPGATAGAATVNPCPSIEILAPTPGEYDFLTKRWIAPADQIVVARSGDHATSRLSWSTGGHGGYEQMVIADTRVGKTPNAGPADPVEKTTYQAFNLVKIKAITPAMDPLLAYDQITAVELWNGTAWASASGADELPYTGSLPEIALNATEQASTQGVRLIFAENTAAREAATAVDAPAVGSGVARSNGNTRQIDLEWELRDTKRVPATPAVPVLGSELYNTADTGDVNNIASASGIIGGSVAAHDEDSDLISILDRPLNVSVSKGWSGGPIGIPPAGTPANAYPSGRVTITATNATVAKVDTLKIVDPAPGSATKPFDTFNLAKIVGITVPAGATNSLVQLTRAGGGISAYSIDQAKALSAANLADVVGIEVTHHGRIVSAGKSTLTMDLRLRATHREGGAPVTVVDSPVRNDASASVLDPGGVNGVHEVTATDGAQMALANLNIGITTTKSFSPQVQYAQIPPSAPNYADEPWDSITMTLSARPTGSARPAKMVVTDDTTTFWNAYRFVDFAPGFKLTAPILRVQVDALVGGTYDTSGGGNPLSLNGATWTLGTPAATPALPAGVTADQVRGLRFTFTRTDGSQWENPANPRQEIPLTVHRRAYLASTPDMPVPTDADPSAPGEKFKPRGGGGVFTNTVQGEVTSSVNGPGSLPLTATHETTAQAFYQAGATEISIKKTPVGAQLAGQTIPFTLTVSNPAPAGSGVERAIRDPKITDILPTDFNTNDPTGKPWLIFDDQSDDPRYEFGYQPSGTTPAPHLPMPTDPAQITITEGKNADGEPTNIAFEFPKGTVLMPGDTYTITLNMMFRPGIAAGQHVTNTVLAEAAQPFQFCNGEAHEVLGCAADTDVYPTEVGALRGQKFVKSNDTELGVTDVTNPAAECTPTVDDFYSGNCVPITKPLGIETWRERVQNSGTLEMDKVVTIDRLPTPGDQGALVLLPRGSQWEPTWTGPITPVTADGYRTPEGVEYYYSSAQDPCVADLSPSQTACPDGAWLPLTPDVAAADVKHIKTVFLFGENHFRPGDILGYTFQTRTPAVSPVATSDTVAWNTIAIGAETVTASGTRIGSVLPTEGRRVGVALATGPLAVQKTVTGDAAAHAPATFELQVVCTVGKGTALETVLPPVTVTVEGGKPVTLEEQFPYGAECVLVDAPGVNGESSSTSGPAVTIGRTASLLPLATLTNIYSLTSLEVTKTVTGALDQDGQPLDYGSFPFEVSCTFLGKPVVATGFEFSPMAFSLEHDQRRILAGLPVGSECVITETDPHGAEVTHTSPGVDGPVTGEGPSVTVTLTSDEAPASAAIVRFVNGFPLGAIDLFKRVEGDGAGAVDDGTDFVFELTCRVGSDVVYDGALHLTKAEAIAGRHIIVDTLPAGARCELDETDSGGASTTVITPDTKAVPAAVGTLREPLQFTAVNTFAAGDLLVTKEITGPGAELWGTGPFEVALACTLDGAAIAIPDGATRELSAENGFETDFAGLPSGAACELTESATGGATTSEIVDADGAAVTEPVIIGSGTTVALRVINTFEVGGITVTKTIEGDNAAAAANAQFQVALACTLDRDGVSTALTIPEGATRTLSAATGLTAAYTQLPTGAVCELRETVAGGANASAITPNAGDPAVGVAIIGSGTSVALSVVNTFTKDPGITPPGPGTPGGELSGTGANPPWGWLMAALGLLLGGTLLGIRQIRRRGTGDLA
ncbi:isopeptide-forming domain-containing fimbrial protein [Mycetocola lacteus]|uniref:Isopeptide-forming domain-containing fimbrial protein n=2 Tax=Mycetocola lacteus TaxID=76637 RepID=A0A3L7ALV3_9MICO|nr:isopeptide-forming domain-containing fimbrial protein [Mycetocola lacteus]RLP84495.1 isopeptide-forming domain-containing fimbrial protein [Mycetocola lacteus]